MTTDPLKRSIRLLASIQILEQIVLMINQDDEEAEENDEDDL